jgi:hypothetical protein
VDAHWLAFPNYDGNGKYQSMGNILKNPHIGMLFIDLEGQWRLRLQGITTISENDALLAAYPGAQFIVRVQVMPAMLILTATAWGTRRTSAGSPQ